MTLVRKVNIADLEDVRLLIKEYYDALQIVVRDSDDEIAAFLRESETDLTRGFWVAYDGAVPIGCVVLRPLGPREYEQAAVDHAGECKRLYVRQSYRGQRIADDLMDELERFAETQGVQWIYLDSKDDLVGAIKLYQRRGYEFCERYNENPQATIFMRRSLR